MNKEKERGWFWFVICLIAGIALLCAYWIWLGIDAEDYSICFRASQCTLVRSENLTSNGFLTGDVWEEWNCTGIRTSGAMSGQRL